MDSVMDLAQTLGIYNEIKNKASWEDHKKIMETLDEKCAVLETEFKTKLDKKKKKPSSSRGSAGCADITA